MAAGQQRDGIVTFADSVGRGLLHQAWRDWLAAPRGLVCPYARSIVLKLGGTGGRAVVGDHRVELAFASAALTVAQLALPGCRLAQPVADAAGRLVDSVDNLVAASDEGHRLKSRLMAPLTARMQARARQAKGRDRGGLPGVPTIIGAAAHHDAQLWLRRYAWPNGGGDGDDDDATRRPVPARIVDSLITAHVALASRWSELALDVRAARGSLTLKEADDSARVMDKAALLVCAVAVSASGDMPKLQPRPIVPRMIAWPPSAAE